MVFPLKENFYNRILKWTEGEWNGPVYSEIINEVSKSLSSIGHGDTPIGDAMYILWEWFDEIMGAMGIGMRDSEFQKELRGLIEKKEADPLKQVEVEVQTSPDVNVTIINLDDLKATADPEHEAKAKKRFEEMFSAFVDEE